MKKLMHALLSWRATVLMCVCLPALALFSLAGPNQAAAATVSTTRPSPPFTPVGTTWTLTVRFLSGSRQGQSETSLMTFRPDGSLTATFPNSNLVAAIDGHWYMTGTGTFHYHFKEPLMQDGQIIAYILVNIDAYMSSTQAYTAAGVGVTYSAATGLPLAGQYNATLTLAKAL